MYYNKFNKGDKVYCRGFVCTVRDWMPAVDWLTTIYLLDKVNFSDSPVIMDNWIVEEDIKHYPLLDVECDFE